MKFDIIRIKIKQNILYLLNNNNPEAKITF